MGTEPRVRRPHAGAAGTTAKLFVRQSSGLVRDVSVTNALFFKIAVETHQPVPAIHGHIHESGGERRIGQTVCINPGSEANHGILRGFLVDIGDGGVERVLRVEG